MTTLIPEAPSADPRWQHPRIADYRVDAAAQSLKLTETDKAILTAHLEMHLREMGIQRLTEDLLLILWAMLPMAADGVQCAIHLNCGAPLACGLRAISHAVTGLDIVGAVLLGFEQRIGEEL